MRGNELGVADVKAHLSKVVQEVQETGVKVTVTSHGKPVADIVPSTQDRQARRREAIARIRKACEERPLYLSEAELKEAREWGRK